MEKEYPRVPIEKILLSYENMEEGELGKPSTGTLGKAKKLYEEIKKYNKLHKDPYCKIDFALGCDNERSIYFLLWPSWDDSYEFEGFVSDDVVDFSLEIEEWKNEGFTSCDLKFVFEIFAILVSI